MVVKQVDQTLTENLGLVRDMCMFSVDRGGRCEDLRYFLRERARSVDEMVEERKKKKGWYFYNKGEEGAVGLFL